MPSTKGVPMGVLCMDGARKMKNRRSRSFLELEFSRQNFAYRVVHDKKGEKFHCITDQPTLKESCLKAMVSTTQFQRPAFIVT